MEPIILASSSPRRKELLRQISIPFESINPDIDEDIDERDPEKLVVLLARRKVEAVRGKDPALEDRWIVGADTVVVYRDEILGKPRDRGQARHYLKLLAGSTHQVLTGLALHCPGRGISTSVTATTVTFSALNRDEIEWYLRTGEWEGAAGAYRIQQQGGVFVQKIEGSPSNVVGLPIQTFYGMVRTENDQHWYT